MRTSTPTLNYIHTDHSLVFFSYNSVPSPIPMYGGEVATSIGREEEYAGVEDVDEPVTDMGESVPMNDAAYGGFDEGDGDNSDDDVATEIKRVTEVDQTVYTNDATYDDNDSSRCTSLSEDLQLAAYGKSSTTFVGNTDTRDGQASHENNNNNNGDDDDETMMDIMGDNDGHGVVPVVAHSEDYICEAEATMEMLNEIIADESIANYIENIYLMDDLQSLMVNIGDTDTSIGCGSESDFTDTHLLLDDMDIDSLLVVNAAP